MAIGALQILWGCVLLYLVAVRHHYFPVATIAYLVVVLLGAIWLLAIESSNNIRLDPTDIVRMFFTVAWIFYFALSKQVKIYYRRRQAAA
jgi:hypothetical protein